MNLQEMVTFQAAMLQLQQERRQVHQAIALTERIADWRLQIRLWNRLHKRYLEALSQQDGQTAQHLYSVLLKTKVGKS